MTAAALPFDNQRVLITGGTGSLGQVLTRRVLTGELGRPASVVVFSRDEAKQHFMRLQHQNRATATDEIIYQHSRDILRFHIATSAIAGASPPSSPTLTSSSTRRR